MTYKNQISKYYKINICEHKNSSQYKCYKVIKRDDGQTTIINYSLDSTIKELIDLKSKNNQKNDMKPIFNFIKIGIISIVFLKFYKEFYF